MGGLPRFIIFLPFQILTIPIDAEPGDLPHIQSAGGAPSPYVLPTRRDDNNDELDQIWIWSAGIQVSYRVTQQVADLGWVDLDLGCSTILLGQ